MSDGTLIRFALALLSLILCNQTRGRNALFFGVGSFIWLIAAISHEFVGDA